MRDTLRDQLRAASATTETLIDQLKDAAGSANSPNDLPKLCESIESMAGEQEEFLAWLKALYQLKP